MNNFIWDEERTLRTGAAEAILCEGKTANDLIALVKHHLELTTPILLTRLTNQQWSQLSSQLTPELQARICYHASSKTAVINQRPPIHDDSSIGVVCAGTSDFPLAQEAKETLRFYGYKAPLICDVGVAGLWRLMGEIENIRKFKIIIAVAGMEGALFSVLAGLVKAPIIALPSPVGYGVNAGGITALNSALGSCSPGIVTVNIDNGFGAAISAIKIMNMARSLTKNSQ